MIEETARVARLAEPGSKYFILLNITDGEVCCVLGVARSEAAASAA